MKYQKFEKSTFFRHEARNHISLYMTNTFKKLLAAASETLNVVPFPNYEAISKENTLDEDIIARYGKEKITQPIDKVFSEIHAVIISDDPILPDDHWIFWYLEFEDQLYYIDCGWTTTNHFWHCDAYKVTSESICGNGHLASPGV